MSEKTLTIRIDDELHKAVKVKIAQEGISLKEYIVSLIQKDLKEK